MLCREACLSYCHKIIILSRLFLYCMIFSYLVKSVSPPPPPPPPPPPFFFSFPINSLCYSFLFYSNFPIIFQPPRPVPFHLLSFPHLLSVLMFLYLNTCFSLHCAHAKLHFLRHSQTLRF